MLASRLKHAFYILIWGVLTLSCTEATLAPDEFDFIIVGGGTAGCVLARRISENGKYSVLVLEAGGVPPEAMDIPALASKFQTNPNMTYQFQSVPQRWVAKANNGVIRIIAGRALGGTSNVNNMRFNRGSPQIYDYWAKLTGDPSWAYSNMLQYFKKSENYFGEFSSTDQHGFGGPIPVSSQTFAPGKDAWLSAGHELGYPVADPNGPQMVSFTPVEYNMKLGRRVSSYKGYLEPVMNSRQNLKVVTNAFVTRVIFEGNTAVGVNYVITDTNSSSPKIATARHEIILSAGAYGSPTLLQRSGIGPTEVLSKAGVFLRKKLPVGQNFQEHPILSLDMVLRNKSYSYDTEGSLTRENFELWSSTGEGPFSTVFGYVGQAFLTSSLSIAEEKEGREPVSDYMLATAAGRAYSSFQSGVSSLNVSLDSDETLVSVFIYLMQGKSRGVVGLDPENINGPPLVDFNYLAIPSDRQIFIEAIHTMLSLFERTPTYQRLGARYPSEQLPACRQFKFRSDAYWECYISQGIVGGYHPAGTCGMTKVVDSKLRVLDTENLRVVDASVMPLITNANLQAVVYAIAEKAADDILSNLQ